MKLTDWNELHSGLFKNTCAEQLEEEVTYLHEVNTTFYAKVPQEIRRCFFLDGNAVNVLLELVSCGMLDRGRRNFYRLNTSLNPYLVLSEALHAFLRHVYSKSNYDVVLEQMEDLDKESYLDKQDLFREAVAMAVLPTISYKDFYQPYARRIQEDILNAAADETGMLSLVNYSRSGA